MARSVVFDFIARDRQYTGPLRRMEGSTVRFGATLGKVSGVAVRAFGGVGVAAVGLGVAGAAMGIKTAAGLEQAQIAFTQLLGSGKEAQKFLVDLKAFAAKTPFELPGLIDSARGLLGVGVQANKVIPILTALGDAAGALGLDQERFNRVQLAVTQSMAKGKIQAEELMQITEAGIPIWQLLSRALDMPVPKLQKLVSQGKLAADDVFPKLFDQMHKDYGGSMAKQSQTLTGLWSTFMDTLNLGLADTIKPLQGELKVGLKGAIEIAQGALKSAADFISGTVVPSLKTAKQWWKDNKDAVKDISDAFLSTFMPAADTVTTATDDLSTAQERLAKKFTGAAIFAANLVKWWIDTRIQTTELMKATYNLIIALGYGANALDKITGGSGHAADAMVEFGREGKRVANEDLAKLRKAAGTTQDAIDRMHGKDIPIKARTNVEVAKSVRQYLAAAGVPGFRAKGGLTRLGETAIVGEEGPELVQFTRPAYVYTAAETRQIRGRGLASGGPVGAQLRDRFYDPTVRQTGRIGQSMADVAAYAIGHSAARPPHVPGGWKVALEFLRQLGIAFNVISTFRPGARTHASGAVSYHARNRAVDLGGNMAGIFGALARTDPTELIWSPAPFYIARGRAKPIGLLDPITRADHWTHVHAAYDKGGELPPGLSVAWNGTGVPERVLSPSESAAAAGAIYIQKGAIQVFASDGMSERRVAELVVDVIDERARRARKGPRA